MRSLVVRCLLLFLFGARLSCLLPSALFAQTVTVNIAPSDASNHFIPDTTLGAGVDRLSTEAVDKAMTRQNLDSLAPSGWQPMTYRQNTDLAVEAWHWNPEGSWSEPSRSDPDSTGSEGSKAGGRGYFTGSAALGKPIRYSYGYALPRRGFTRNDGTGNTGYSRLTDGDMRSFWKSNPYLTQPFTAEDDSRHPQWVILDLSRAEPIDSIRIAWGAPYATRYLIQFWTGSDPIGQPTRGVWQSLPNGIIEDGKGGLQTIRLADEPVGMRFLRMLMTQSSNTCDADGSSDIRNCVGYAINEIYAGTTTPDGGFHDMLRHTPDQDQSTTYCSSVDPWHESADLQNKSQAQVGFDHFFTSGVTHGLPAMVPVAMIYSQPEDAVAEIQYLEARHYPISYVEMGEEADGQYMSPEDNAALYLQFATALHRFDPTLKLGGPAFQGSNEDIQTLPDALGRTSWLARFLDYLKEKNRLQDLAFFSFEHYPFEPCKIPWSSLYEEPELINHIMHAWRSDGLPKGIPIFITESNLSSSASETYMDTFAGLWLADYIGSFLTAGGNGVYYFHYLPLQIDRGCNNSPGTFGMFTIKKDYTVDQPLSQFFASQLINTEWVQPGKESNAIFPASATISDGAGHVMVTAYALHRPDHKWSVMLVNRDQEAAHTVSVVFRDAAAGPFSHFTGNIDTITFGAAQYQWHPAIVSPMSHPEEAGQSVSINKLGRAEPDGPLKRETIPAPNDARFEVPEASIVVLRGDISAVP